MATIVCASLVIPMTSRGDGSGPAADVAFSGRVVDVETGKPVAGASVIVERSIRRGSRDAPALGRREHDFDRRRRPLPADLPARAGGRPPASHRSAGPASRHSSPGNERQGRVHRHHGRAGQGRRALLRDSPARAGSRVHRPGRDPGGKPVAGIPYSFENGARGPIVHSTLFMDDTAGQTDDDGRIRLRMPKSHSVALFVGPPQTARARFPLRPLSSFLGYRRPREEPECLGPDRPRPDRAIARHPALGTARRHPRAGRSPDRPSRLIRELGRDGIRPRPRPTAASPSVRSGRRIT